MVNNDTVSPCARDGTIEYDGTSWYTKVNHDEQDCKKIVLIEIQRTL